MATQDDADPAHPGFTLVRPSVPSIGATGFIAYRAESHEFNEFTESMFADDRGTKIVVAKIGDAFGDGLTIRDFGGAIEPIDASDTLLLFRVSAARNAYVTWDASRGLRKLVAIGDPLPDGSVVEDFLDRPVANPTGQALFLVRAAGRAQLVRLEPGGALTPVLRAQQSIPGSPAHSVTAFDRYHLADDGRVTLQVAGFDGGTPVVVHSFILQGQPGALGLEASTVAGTDLERSIQLLGASPNGQLAYTTVEIDHSLPPDAPNRRRQIRLGGAGDTQVIADLIGTQSLALGAYAWESLAGQGRLANGNELVLETTVKRGTGSTGAIVAHHDGAWMLVAANDVALPGATQPRLASATSLNSIGQILVATTQGLWRHTPGQPLELIAHVGLTYDVGTGAPVAAIGTSDARLDEAGDVVFLLAWNNAVGNVATTVFTTQLLPTRPDLKLERVEADLFVPRRGSPRLALKARAVNVGTVAVPSLRFHVDVDAGFADIAAAGLSAECQITAASTTCEIAVGLAPGESIDVELYLASFAETGTLSVIVDEDVDPSNDSLLFEAEVVKQDPHGCSTTRRGAWPLALVVALLVARRRRQA